MNQAIKQPILRVRILNGLPSATIIIALTTSMAACGADGQANAAPQAVSHATHDKVEALLDKTRKNLRFIEGGSFQMGDFGPIHSPEKLFYNSQQSNKFLHKVSLDSFSMSAYKTTYSDLDVYSEATGRRKVGMDDWTRDFRYPDAAGGINWQQARNYCQWLGGLLKLPMDLPTEAQWEYAARNRGQMFVFPTDNGMAEPGRNVWGHDQREDYIEKKSFHFYSPSLPLGQFPPTPLGLYDMMTDGYEWTLDWYDENYYEKSPEHNPRGPSLGKERVLRSFPSQGGEGLSFGDGMTFERSRRLPEPPSKNRVSGKLEPGHNMTQDTAARCVVNNTASINATS